jgi:Ankyrin repeat
VSPFIFVLITEILLFISLPLSVLQDGGTALVMAAYYGNLDIVSLLLDKGARIEAAGHVRFLLACPL